MSIGSLPFSLRDVIEEIYGVGYSGTKSLYDCHTDADPAVTGSSTVKLTLGGYLKRETQGDYHAFAGGETLEFTGDRNESVGVYKSGTGTPITAGDAVRLEIYYRTKQTSGSWTFSVGWNNYASATYGPHALTLTVNDYKFVLTTNI
jgi:hypothetical protein